MQRTNKNTKKQVKARILLYLGLFCMLISAAWFGMRTVQWYSMTVTATSQKQAVYTKISAPNPVFLTAKNTNVTIREGAVFNGQWILSTESAFHYDASSRPTEPGNIIIYGHNTKNIFKSLKTVQKDDVITLTTEDQQTHDYTIIDIQVVSPSETEYLQPTQEEILTVYTCTGLMDTKRLVIRAKPKR
jgi:LPXTG-site transpeptidase (sortase) family protein